MQDLVVRAATAADLSAASALAAELLRLHHGWDPARFFTVDDPAAGYAWFFARELDDADAIVLVAERAGRVIGYAYGRLEPRDWNALLDACGWIHDLYVHPDERGGGAGGALVGAMAERFAARGAPRVVLAAAARNEAGQRLFAKLGFRPTMIEMTRELP